MPDPNLHLPRGTEAFYLDEAYAHRELVRTFEDRCELWGYLPVQTPVYDYHEPYRGLVDRSREGSTYRLFDRAGDLLVLRSDITLFLARQMGLVLNHGDLPVRVCYGDTILRHEDPYDISQNEYFQVGAELIGATGLDADAEIVLLLFEALDHWGAHDVVVHIGHRALLHSYNGAGLLAPAVAGRDWERTGEALREAGLEQSQTRSLLRLYSFIGPTDDLRRLLDDLPDLDDAERRAAEHLLLLAEELEALGYGERIRLDLSEVGSQVYHSGIVFQAYAPDTAGAIASGGRYDGLLGHFGFDAPSVGFSVMLRRLQARRPAETRRPEPTRPVQPDAPFRERYRSAQQARSRGEVIAL